MAVTISTNYILKTLWPQSRVENLVYPDHTLLAMLPKDEKFYGENMYIAVRGADSQGRSATFSTAQGASGAHAGKRFLITRVADYQVCTLSTEAIMASKNDKGALIRNLDTELESGMNNIGKSLATSLFRGQSGAIGQVGAVSANAAAPATITLLNINDVTSFEVGMALAVFSAKSGGSSRLFHDQTNSGVITGVDRDTGVLTFAAASFNTDYSTVAVNDYLFPVGDRGLKISGLADWVPSSAPVLGTDSFFGVDRGADPVRYGGLRIDVSALNPEEACVTAFSRINREGGKPKHLFVNHLDYRNIGISLGSKVVYEDMQVGDIGFQAIKINSAKGPVAVLADQDCPQGTGYAMQMDTWKLYSLEKCPQVLDLDGNRLLRVFNADNWEARIAYFAQLACSAPGWNGVLTMPA